MTVLFLILLIAGLACFLVAAFNLATVRVNLIALGLAFWILVPLIQTAQLL